MQMRFARDATLPIPRVLFTVQPPAENAQHDKNGCISLDSRSPYTYKWVYTIYILYTVVQLTSEMQFTCTIILQKLPLKYTFVLHLLSFALKHPCFGFLLFCFCFCFCFRFRFRLRCS